ncbi:hypothetical protein K501DRAFT_288347, partial [Backusella circina FSU 941]
MSVVHAIIPLVITSSSPPLNLLYAAAPWFLLSHTAHMPVEDLTLWTWIESLFNITMDKKLDHQGDSSFKVRLDGVSKMCLGLAKLCFMYGVIDRMLPRRTEIALEYPWASGVSMMYTLLYGIKAYLMLGIIDIFMGLEQTITGWRMIYLFDIPIISYSPRDFWSRRWNKIVRNLLHQQIFSCSTSRDDIKYKKSQDFWSAREGRGLLSFIVSGIFHELIIMSCCRRMTFENLVFFTLQGIAVLVEVKLRQGALKQEPTGITRICLILTQLMFMMWAGRLFTGPFLRYQFL